MDSNSTGYIELNFGPRWKYIAVTRAFIQNFIAISIDDAERADKVAMATSELLENGVKYASAEGTFIRLHVDPESKREINVVVENEATAEQIAELQKMFDTVAEGDPLQTYVELMKQSALRDDGKSQLGLARIRYETAGDLSLQIKDGHRVVITLQVKLEG